MVAFPSLFAPVARADDVITNVMSPIVSYQYPDDFGSQALTNGGILSPIVSYVYCEWPRNENVALQTSPTVSYFYQGGASGGAVAFQGRVVNALGQPMEQAIVEARVMESPAASMTTGTDGRYALPSLPAGTYSLSAVKAGWLSDRRVVALSAATMQQDLQLRPLLAPPSLTVTNSTPAFIPPPDGAQGSALRVFDGTAFVANLALLDRAKMTVVLTHGWIPCDGPVEPTPVQDANGWPLRLAVALESQGTRSIANIVAWDWHEVARPCLPLLGMLTPPPEEATPSQGIALGESLQQALGTDYRRKVHFIGHSLGTLVNGYAVDYLHGHQRAEHRVSAQPWLSANTHVTMSDDAAIARLIAKETLAKLLLNSGKSYAASVALGWKNPVPHDFLWLDNYIASVGRYHPEAVNVLLQKGDVAGAGGPQLAWCRSGGAQLPNDELVSPNSHFAESDHAGLWHIVRVCAATSRQRFPAAGAGVRSRNRFPSG
jgi:hypothetical protein